MILILIYLICGFIAYSGAFADFEHRLSKPRENRGIALFFGLLGPMGLVTVFLSTGFFQHGFKV